MRQDPNSSLNSQLADICAEAGDLKPADVRRWLAQGWIRRPDANDGPSFISISAKRALLIREVRDTLGVADESVEIVLRLIDQLHVERRKLACLNAALDAESGVAAEGVRSRAARIFRDGIGSSK